MHSVRRAASGTKGGIVARRVECGLCNTWESKAGGWSGRVAPADRHCMFRIINLRENEEQRAGKRPVIVRKSTAA